MHRDVGRWAVPYLCNVDGCGPGPRQRGFDTVTAVRTSEAGLGKREKISLLLGFSRLQLAVYTSHVHVHLIQATNLLLISQLIDQS